MDLTLLHAAAVFVTMFVGEVFGSLFGGGSFFIQPALVLMGVPAKLAIANEITAAAFSSLGFVLVSKERSPYIRRCAGYAIPTILIGAFIGGHVLKAIPDRATEAMIFVICLIGFAYILTRALRGQKVVALAAPAEPIRHWKIAVVIAGFFFGFYDGISGAGSGIIMIAVLSMITRMGMKTVLTLTNTISLISLAAAGLTFLWLGLLDFKLLAIMIPAAFIGGVAAARISEIVPEHILRGVYIVVLCALLIYFGINLVSEGAG